MEEQLITFETAKLAKDKGFKEFSYACYKEDGILENLNNIWHYGCEGGMELDEWFYDYNNYKHKKLISAPTQSLLQKWLREEYSIQVMVTSHNHAWVAIVENAFTPYKWINNFNSYENALEQGLLEALKLIK